METKPKVINGLSFEITQPYIEGHVLSALEARVLNQTRSENIGNNARAKIKEMQDAGNAVGDIVAYVQGVDAEYIFRTASEGGGRSVDPYEREARSIAKGLLREHLASTGRKLAEVPAGSTADEWKEKVDAEIDRIASTDQVLAAAKKTVDAKKKTASALLESLGEVTV